MNFCTFSLGGMRLGIEIEAVQEVIQGQPVTFVPLAQHAVAGLMNLRGNIIPTVNLRRCLHLPEVDGWAPMNVVVRHESGPIAFLVDDVGDVIDVPPSTFDPVCDSLKEEHRELIRGAYALEDGLLLALDASCVIASLTAGLCTELELKS